MFCITFEDIAATADEEILEILVKQCEAANKENETLPDRHKLVELIDSNIQVKSITEPKNENDVGRCEKPHEQKRGPICREEVERLRQSRGSRQSIGVIVLCPFHPKTSPPGSIPSTSSSCSCTEHMAPDDKVLLHAFAGPYSFPRLPIQTITSPGTVLTQSILSSSPSSTSSNTSSPPSLPQSQGRSFLSSPSHLATLSSPHDNRHSLIEIGCLACTTFTPMMPWSAPALVSSSTLPDFCTPEPPVCGDADPVLLRWPSENTAMG